MTDQTPQTFHWSRVDHRAADAVQAAVTEYLTRNAPKVAQMLSRDDLSDVAGLAIGAAGRVYAAAEQADADRLIAETGLAGIDIADGSARVKLVLAHEMAVNMAMAFDAILDAHPSAANYVEQEFFPRGSRDPYVYVVCKPGGKTPHQLRRDAEEQRDRYAGALQQIIELINESEGTIAAREIVLRSAARIARTAIEAT